MNKKINTNYILGFNGWAQCRLATDPDPSNDPRGVSGYTFALPGEPDFDQIIYFQNKRGVVQRSFCPKIDVRVRRGYEYQTNGSGGTEEFVSKTEITKGHPLYEAKVDLLGKPVFDSRNSTIVFNGFGIINPFILDIRGKRINIQRRFYAEPDNPQNDLENYPIDKLESFAMNTAFMDSVDMILSPGVVQRSAFRNERLKTLEGELSTCTNPVEIAALNKRISELKINDPGNRRTRQIGTKALVNYPLNAKTAIYNGRKITPANPWNMELWMGGWDADALSFWVEGFVQVEL